VRLAWLPVVLLIVALAGCSDATVTPHGGSAASEHLGPVVPRPTSSSGAPAIEAAAFGSTPARDLLARLPIKPALSIAGYVRTADFGEAWIDVDHNDCDTRDDILARDLTAVTMSGPCKVTAGTLTSPYTGGVIHFIRGENTSAEVQIDHLVALGDAWETGAQDLTQAERITLANDPLELLAVDGPSNDDKGDSDAASWLPPNESFDCAYVARQISVKLTYSLWVTQSEHDAMARVLAACPNIDGTASAFAAVTPVAARPSTAAPVPTPESSAAVPPAAQVVHSGAYCSTSGALGETAKGAPMVCDTTAADSRLRWRSAG